MEKDARRAKRRGKGNNRVTIKSYQNSYRRDPAEVDQRFNLDT